MISDDEVASMRLTIRELKAENTKLRIWLGDSEMTISKLRAALEELRAGFADKGDLDGELMAEAALSNEQKGK